MIQNETLSSARLRLNQCIRRSSAYPQRVILRPAEGYRRLVLNTTQARILFEHFDKPRTVPEVLVRLLGLEICPPLIELYELVLQAQASGVLVDANKEPEQSPAELYWPIKLKVPWGERLGYTVLAISLAALLLLRWHGPVSFYDWVAGFICACALLSLGEVAGACALAGAGCEIRRLHFKWRTLLPHLSLASEEAIMGGSKCELGVAALRMAPPIAGAALLAWLAPGWLLPVLIAVIYTLSPWNGTAATQWLAARYKLPVYSVLHGSIMSELRGDPWPRWQNRWRGMSTQSVLQGLLWIMFSMLVLLRTSPGLSGALLAWLGPAGKLRLLVGFSACFLIGTAIFIAGAMAWSACVHWWIQRKLINPRREDASNIATTALKGDVPAILRLLPLFQNLNNDDLIALAAAFQPIQVEKHRAVFQEDDPGDAFYVLLSGKVEILKRSVRPAEPSISVGWLGPGAAFGEIALLEGTVRSATITARSDCALLRLSKVDFGRFIIAQVGSEHVRDLLLQVRFLSRLTFLAGWPLEDLFAMARRCGTATIPAGVRVLQKGVTNNWFFLIYDGTFEVREKERVLRRMVPGDYFGEISLLTNSEATADVVAVEEGRCLTMYREVFLGFFAKDYRIGMQIEALAKQRLGTGVFMSR